jgi:hypothetical protein
MAKLGFKKGVEHTQVGLVEDKLTSFVKRGYLEKLTTMNGDEGNGTSFIWGPRATVEFPQERLLIFLKKVYMQCAVFSIYLSFNICCMYVVLS